MRNFIDKFKTKLKDKFEVIKESLKHNSLEVEPIINLKKEFIK